MKRHSLNSLGVAVLSAAFIAGGCAKKTDTAMTDSTHSATGATTDNTAAKKAKMQAFYDKVFNAHNTAMVDSFVTPDYTEHNPDPGQKPGAAGLKESFTQFFTAFPDVHADVKEIAVDGDYIIAHAVMSGTMKGDMMGMKASGKSMSGIDYWDEVKINSNGMATDHWGAGDMMKMMGQLGMGPQGAPGKPEAAPKAK